MIKRTYHLIVTNSSFFSLLFPLSSHTNKMARYFDPAVYNIILVDQRGCGNSTPFASLEENTTYDSVRDFEKIRKLLSKFLLS
jgi:pimeloyl-ACP methyl ester carboxylesterase